VGRYGACSWAGVGAHQESDVGVGGGEQNLDRRTIRKPIKRAIERLREAERICREATTGIAADRNTTPSRCVDSSMRKW